MARRSAFELLRGELVDIVDYAVECHKKTGRPLRLAVNASSWWYANLTAAAVRGLRNKAGLHINPIERNILFYTLRILRLGIQLHFVFDGPRRLSNGGKLYPGHDAPSLLLQQTLTNIGVPWHEAPAEAEAECAKMEMEKIVDGVWSEDGDALAFGCQTLIKFHIEIRSSTEREEDKRKSSKHFKVYRLGQYPGMDRAGFILNAVLNGRPSDVRELYNLQPQDVLHAAMHGLGRSLCAASDSGETLRKWATKDFAGYLHGTGSNIEIPSEFPKWEHVQDYINPVVSTAEVFLNLPELQDAFLDEEALFSFLKEKFQWTIKQWVKYVIPVRIVRSLLATKEGEESQHNYLKLKCDLKKSPKKAEATFLLCKATSLDVSTLYREKEKLETLSWILRKANLNEQHSITSYFITPPKSDQTGKGLASVSASEKPSRRLSYRASREPITPSSCSPSNSNGEGSSRRIDTSRRQATPPSPTPTSRKRSLPWVLGAKVSKNIQPAAKANSRTSDKNDRGKGKEKEIPVLLRVETKRARSPSDPRSSNEKLRDKRPKLYAGKRPTTPPAQIIAPADAVPDFISISSDSERDRDVANNSMVIDSDSESDSDGYGSFPEVADLPTLFEDQGVEVGQDHDLKSSSEDEYGSFPSSPDLLALM